MLARCPGDPSQVASEQPLLRGLRPTESAVTQECLQSGAEVGVPVGDLSIPIDGITGLLISLCGPMDMEVGAEPAVRQAALPLQSVGVPGRMQAIVPHEAVLRPSSSSNTSIMEKSSW